MQSLSILFFHSAGIAIIEPLKEPFLTHRFFLFQECNPNESIFLNYIKLSCNIDVTQRYKLPKDMWHSVPSWTFCCIKLPTHCSLYLLKNKLVWSFRTSCRVHQAVMVSASARKKFLCSAWDADITLAAHFYEMQSFSAEDNSLSHMFVLGINMHSDLTHTHTHASYMA